MPHAEEMANRYGAEIIFLRVEELHVMLGWDEVVDLAKCHEKFDPRKKASESYLIQLKAEFRDKGIKTKTHVVYGPVVKSILTTAEEMNVDIIVMASHGLSGLPRTFYGSVTAGVLQKIDRQSFEGIVPEAVQDNRGSEKNNQRNSEMKQANIKKTTITDL